MKFKVSIVIPAYNEEKFLSECLESLKNQDYKGEYEIIVVDNCSTDNTVKIAERNGVKVILCQKKGVIYARQAGADEASGDIIAQADADTVYPKDWLTRIIKHFSLHPEAVAVGGGFVYKKTSPPINSSFAKLEHLYIVFINMLAITFLGRPFLVSGANFAFYREMFIKIKGYKEKSLFPDQYGISSWLATTGKIVYDRKLNVMTSPRRPQMPYPLLFRHVITKCINVFRYFLKMSSDILQTSL
jgi:glycosyltransferase involved in cell wall biosynthesis